MHTIRKRFHFSASHQLDGLPPDHPCARLHGHNYEVEVEVQADRLDQVGMVLDYAELAAAWAPSEQYLDHRHLNDVLGFNPTAENLAEHLHAHVGMELWRGLDGPTRAERSARNVRLVAVRVMETPRSLAEYRVPG